MSLNKREDEHYYKNYISNNFETKVLFASLGFYLCKNIVAEMTSHYAQANKTCKSFGILQNVNNAPNYSNGDQTEQKCRGLFTNKTILAINLQQSQISGKVLKNYLNQIT